MAETFANLENLLSVRDKINTITAETNTNTAGINAAGLTVGSLVHWDGDRLVSTSQENFIQFPASSINPTPGATAAEIVRYGLGTALRFASNLDRKANVNFRVPYTLDVSKQMAIRTAWTSDVIVGDVKLRLEYQWVGPNTPVALTGTSADSIVAVNGVADTPSSMEFAISAPPAGANVLLVEYTRVGSDVGDTSVGSVFLIGSSFVYNIT